MQRRILIIDDDRSMCDVLDAELRRRDFVTTTTTGAEDALRRLGEDDFDLVLTDINMHSMSGVDLCRQIAETREHLPVVVMTAYGSMEAAIAAIRAGAYDFVTKPFEMDDIALTIERALKHRALREEVKRLRRVVIDSQKFDDILGTSQAMVKMYDLVARVADTETTVLITGESGTGKELIAKAIHQRSARREGPFVAINCAAMPENLLESELFGHVKGAFTDARNARPGLFIRASKGTLFLDEIGEMPPGMQAKLLRALQRERHAQSGGIRSNLSTRASSPRPIATWKPKSKKSGFAKTSSIESTSSAFTCHRCGLGGATCFSWRNIFCSVINQTVPERVLGIKSAAADKLLSYTWPGNVRELQNCLERAVALAQFDHVGIDDLPERIREFKSPRVTIETSNPAELLPMDEVERRYIVRVLEAVGGNKTLAAQVLGFDRRTLYRKLERGRESGPPKREHTAHP